MIIHCTRKLAAKLAAVSPTALAEASSLGSWHAHIYRIEHRQCVAFCHDATRYMLFIPGFDAARFREIGRWHREALLGALAYQGIPDAAVRRAELALGPVQCDRTTDRSVLSSMRIAMDMVFYEAAMEEDVMRLDPLKIERLLNGRPAKTKDVLVWPDKAMADLVIRL